MENCESNEIIFLQQSFLSSWPLRRCCLTFAKHRNSFRYLSTTTSSSFSFKPYFSFLETTLTRDFENLTKSNFNQQSTMQLLEQAQSLLNFDSQATFDVNILDAVINTMYRGQGDAVSDHLQWQSLFLQVRTSLFFFFQQRQASEVLNVLRDHPDAWTKVDSILECSKCQETKYYALQILEKTIKTRWKALPKEQCEGNERERSVVL